MKKDKKGIYEKPKITSSSVLRISLYGSNTLRSAADAELLLAGIVS